MAVLPDADRGKVNAHWMRFNLEPCSFTKTQLRAAVDATDQWIEDNQTSFNTALPTAFRNSASTAQKTLLFCYVAMRRANLLKVEGE